MALSHQYSDIFLSYSRGNSAFVRQLFERLDEGEVQVWIDWDDIPPTAEWWHEIETGIDAANTFVFVMSTASLSSPVCHMELAHAIASNKRIVPVLHEQADRSQATRVLLDRVAENAYIQALLAGRDPQAVADENWTLLESLNWLFMRASDDFDTAFATLIQSLNTDIDHVRAHTILLVRAREWDTRHRENSFLLGGQQITEAENWLAQGLEKTPPPTALQMEYISASRLAATRRQRLIQSSMLVALVGTIVFSVLLALAATDANEQRTFAVTSQALAEANEATAISNAQTATVAQGVAEQNAATATVAQGEAFIQRDRADQQAQLALSRQLAAQASTLFTDAPEEALLIALEAFRIADTEEARRSLIEGLQTAPQIRYAIQAYPNPIQQLHFSPDSRTMATIDNEDGLLLWDVETAQQLNLSPDIWWSVNTAQFDDTGNLVTVGALSRFATWDSRTGAPISLPALTDLSNTSEASLSTALSRDGRRLATFQPFLSRVALTDTASSDIIVSIDIGDAMEAFSEISEIALSDRGDRLLMYGGSTLSLWDESTGAIYEPANEFVYTAALSPNGQLLAWAEFINQRAIIRVWAVEKQSMLTSIEPDIDFPIRTLQFDEASHVLYYGTTEGSVGGYDVLAQEVVLPLTRAHTTSIEALAINATGDLLLSGDETGVVILWDINQTDRLARHLTTDFSRHVRYLGEDQRYLLAANVDLAIYDLQNPAEPMLVQPTDYDQYVRKIAWDADRSLLATLGGQGGVLKLWHVQIVDGQPRIDLLADDLQRDISDMDFSPDGHYLLTVADDHINAFAIDESMGDWAVEKVDLPDVPAVSVVAVDPANNRLATGQIFSVGDLINSESSTDNKVTLYSLDERGLPYGDPVRTIILPQRFLTVPWLIAFSPDGALMAATDIEGNIGIWSLTDESAAPLLINSPLRTINSMQFSADSTLLLTTNTEGEIQQWDVLSGREAGAPLGRTGNPLLDLDVDASGSIVAASEDGILLWRFDDEQLANLVCERANLVLSPAQWRQYFGDVPYRASCPDRTLTAADLLMLQGDRENAQTLLTETVEGALRLADAQFSSTVCLVGALMTEPTVVLPACDQSLQLAPDAAQTWQIAGIAYALADDPTTAISQFQQANGLDPSQTDQRNGWIASLEAGSQPFDPLERQTLRQFYSRELDLRLAQLPFVARFAYEMTDRIPQTTSMKRASFVRWFNDHALSFAPFLSPDLHAGLDGWVIAGGIPAGRLSLVFDDERIGDYVSDPDDAIVLALQNDTETAYTYIFQSPRIYEALEDWQAALEGASDAAIEDFDGYRIMTARRRVGGLFSAATFNEYYLLRDGVQIVFASDHDETSITKAIIDHFLATPAVTDSSVFDDPTPQTISEVSGPLRSGQNHGELAAGQGQRWLIDAQAGDVLYIQAQADYDIRLELYGPDGSLFLKNDDVHFEWNEAVLFAATFPTDGAYELVVASYDNLYAGPYYLYAYTPDQMPTLQLGSNAGYIVPEQFDVWYYQGTAGERIQIELVASWIGSFDLFNAAGERLDRSVYYTVEEGRDWIPSFTVPEDGIYPILVYGFDEVEYGIYSLQVRQLD